MTPDDGRGPRARTIWSTLATDEFLAFSDRVPDKAPLLVEALERLHELHEADLERDARDLYAYRGRET